MPDKERKPCSCIGQLMGRGYDFPFTQPLGFNIKKMELVMPSWFVTLHKKTRSGKRSSTGSQLVALNYCPFCGQKFPVDKDDFAPVKLREVPSEAEGIYTPIPNDEDPEPTFVGALRNDHYCRECERLAKELGHQE